MNEGVRRVLVVGGGTAGWMTAAALSQALGRTGVSIELIESEQIGTVGVGESTIPHIRWFNARLGVDEQEFLARTKATIKLGIEFHHWGRLGDRYMHPFGAFGEDLGGVEFHHHWLRLGGEAAMGPLDDYALPIAMARRERFAPPAADPASPLSAFSYAYQFDAGLYARFLRDYAEARGVRRIEGRISAVGQDPHTGFIRDVTLESGAVHGADLFVDCSGFRGLLIEQTLQAGFEDWSRWLPCDRAVAMPCASAQGFTPYTRVTAREAGWIWRIPLQHRTGNGHVYCSAFLDDDAAEAALVAQLDGEPLGPPNRLRFKAGRRRRQWSGNCVAIGLSSGFLEPLESTSIHLIQAGIGYLLDLFPTGEWDPADADEFNRVMDLEFERIRDFLILHYKATERTDTPFWAHCGAMEIPDSLASKIELFRSRGAIAEYELGVFLQPSWLAVLVGQHVLPRAFDPRALDLDEAATRARLQAFRRETAALAESLPGHAAMLGLGEAGAAAMAGGA